MESLGDEELAQAWDAFKASGDIEARNRLFVHYNPLVRRVAARVAAGLPAMVDREDLVSYGQFGLIAAMNGFDRERGVTFGQYAQARIRGSIIDEIRKLDWVPRAVRASARKLAEAQDVLAKELNRMPTDQEVAEYLGVSMEDYWATTGHATVSVVEDEVAASGVWDHASNPEELFLVQEVTERLGTVVGGLDERDRIILALCYLEEMTLSEVGKVLGVTESRVCQLQGKILVQVRESLRSGLMAGR